MSIQNASAELRDAIKEVGFNRTLDIEFGVVVDDDPLKVSMDGVSILFGVEELVLSERLTKHEIHIEIDGEVRMATVNGELRRGDRIALIYDQDQYKYVVIDRVVNAINYYDD